MEVFVMDTYYLRIRDKFIENIKQRVKKHEYRLASPERRNVKVGDHFVLISNQNEERYIRVVVKKITWYPSWKEALKENWEQDFQNIYHSLEEALGECENFYRKPDVERYGIVSFDIEPVFLDYPKSKILLDQDVFLKKERGQDISYDFARLWEWFDRKHSRICLLEKVETLLLEEESDPARKKMMKERLASYEMLPLISATEDAFFSSLLDSYPQTENGPIERLLLWEVYHNSDVVLLTENPNILKKAEKLFLRDKVLDTVEMLNRFEMAYPQNVDYKMLSVKLKRFQDIHIQDPFFDSLREDYQGKKFDDWFRKKGDAKAYVFEDQQEHLKGFLYPKIEDKSENYSDIDPVFVPKRRLKVGTFKIESTGFRLGERFLKIIFDNALQWDVDEIYVTMYDTRQETRALKKLMEDWGFVPYGKKKSTGEWVLTKDMRTYDEKRSPMFNFPLLKPGARYFFLPIRAEYHTDLFPDNILKNENMHQYNENLAHRYAIEKIYLTGAWNIPAKPGDVLLIYRMGEGCFKKYASVVTGMAVLQGISYTKTVEECIKICKNKSIFHEEEIRDNYDKYPNVVKLLDYKPFLNKVTLGTLRERGIIDKQGGPRPFTPLVEEQFEIIYGLGMEEKHGKENTDVHQSGTCQKHS